MVPSPQCRAGDRLNGVLVVDKPSGPSSHDIVACARRALGTSRVGHTGTLDPLATGVLPLVIGSATRLAKFLSGADKTYEAGIRLGSATDTYDATGDAQPSGLGPEGAARVSRDEVELALGGFRGAALQQPPAFSAKRVKGVRAYAEARRDRPVALSPAAVEVTDLALLDFRETLVTLRVTASTGFYVRTLAHELGMALGCGAHLETLRRTRSGEFTLADAVPLDRLLAPDFDVARHLVTNERLLPRLPVAGLTERGERRARHGNTLTRPEDLTGDRGSPPADDATVAVRVFDRSDRLVAIAEPRPDGSLHPVIVLM